MTAVDTILDQSDANTVRAITTGLLAAAAEHAFSGRHMHDSDRFALWAASTAAHARLIELWDVQRLTSEAWLSRHAAYDGPVGEIPPVLGRVA